MGFAFTRSALKYLETLPPKLRKQVLRKARALHADPHPVGSKKLQGEETDEGEPIYRAYPVPNQADAAR